MIFATQVTEIRNLCNMFLMLRKFDLKEDKPELECDNENLITKRDLGIDHEDIGRKL